MIYTHISHGLFDSSFEDGSVAHARSPPGSLSDALRRGRHGYIACRTTAINTLRRAVVYAYDLRGRKTYEGGATYPVRSVYDVFGNYNPRGELILATNVVTGAEFAYRYDDIGNRLWSRELGTNCTYAANELNQYTNVVRGGVFELSAFDLDGNQTNLVTSTGEWSVEYNGENRPVRWTRNSDGTVVTMSYDIRGRRVTKNAERFVYDGYLNIGQTVWDPTEPVATRPLVWLGEDGLACFFHDGNKNVVDFVPTGVAPSACHYAYTPFGMDTGSAGDPNPWRFSSEWQDEEMCVIYYNHRHYGYMVGRWLAIDPLHEFVILENEKNNVFAQPHELYLFVQNDPLNHSDWIGWGQVGAPIKCGNCLICVDNDSASGDGNSYKIHWQCGRHGRPSTCRGGGAAQWPSGDPSHGSGPVPPNIRRCLDQTRWALRKVEASVPNSKGCCETRHFWTAEPSSSGTSLGTPSQKMIGLCSGGFLILVLLLAPVGI